MGLSVITDATFQSEVLNDKGYVLIDFWAEWCGPCKMLAPVLEVVAKKFEGRVKLGKLDVDTNANTASKYAITSIPCNILFKDGKEVGRIIGHRPEAAFSQELEKLTQG
jgi:thioredoxin 1